MPTSSRGLLIAAVGMIAGTPDALILRLAIVTGASLRVVLFWRFVTTRVSSIVCFRPLDAQKRPLHAQRLLLGTRPCDGNSILP